MARSDPQFNLRIPQELKDKIEQSARADGRSVNAQAVYLLQKGLQPNDQPAPPDNIIKRLDELTQDMTDIKQALNIK